MACSPDDRHITSVRYSIGIVDKDRGKARHPDVHLVGVVDEHYVESLGNSIRSLGEINIGRRFQATPLQADAGITRCQQTHLTYSCISRRPSAAAHDQHRFVGCQRSRCAVRASRKAVGYGGCVRRCDRLRGIRNDY